MESICEKLWETIVIIEEIIVEMSEEDINTIVSPNKRTIGQLLFHLATYEKFYFSFMLARLFYNKDTIVDTYDDNEQSKAWFTKEELSTLVRELKETRKDNIRILLQNNRFLKDHHITHKCHGDLYLIDILNKVCVHDKHHLDQIMILTPKKYF